MEREEMQKETEVHSNCPITVLRNRLHNICLCLMMLQSIANEVNFNISPAECIGSSEHCLGTV